MATTMVRDNSYYRAGFVEPLDIDSPLLDEWNVLEFPENHSPYARGPDDVFHMPATAPLAIFVVLNTGYLLGYVILPRFFVDSFIYHLFPVILAYGFRFEISSGVGRVVDRYLKSQDELNKRDAKLGQRVTDAPTTDEPEKFPLRIETPTNGDNTVGSLASKLSLAIVVAVCALLLAHDFKYSSILGIPAAHILTLITILSLGLAAHFQLQFSSKKLKRKTTNRGHGEFYQFQQPSFAPIFRPQRPVGNIHQQLVDPQYARTVGYRAFQDAHSGKHDLGFEPPQAKRTLAKDLRVKDEIESEVPRWYRLDQHPSTQFQPTLSGEYGMAYYSTQELESLSHPVNDNPPPYSVEYLSNAPPAENMLLINESARHPAKTPRTTVVDEHGITHILQAPFGSESLPGTNEENQHMATQAQRGHTRQPSYTNRDDGRKSHHGSGPLRGVVDKPKFKTAKHGSRGKEQDEIARGVLAAVLANQRAGASQARLATHPNVQDDPTMLQSKIGQSYESPGAPPEIIYTPAPPAPHPSSSSSHTSPLRPLSSIPAPQAVTAHHEFIHPPLPNSIPPPPHGTSHIIVSPVPPTSAGLATFPDTQTSFPGLGQSYGASSPNSRPRLGSGDSQKQLRLLASIRRALGPSQAPSPLPMPVRDENGQWRSSRQPRSAQQHSIHPVSQAQEGPQESTKMPFAEQTQPAGQMTDSLLDWTAGMTTGVGVPGLTSITSGYALPESEASSLLEMHMDTDGQLAAWQQNGMADGGMHTTLAPDSSPLMAVKEESHTPSFTSMVPIFRTTLSFVQDFQRQVVVDASDRTWCELLYGPGVQGDLATSFSQPPFLSAQSMGLLGTAYPNPKDKSQNLYVVFVGTDAEDLYGAYDASLVFAKEGSEFERECIVAGLEDKLIAFNSFQDLQTQWELIKAMSMGSDANGLLAPKQEGLDNSPDYWAQYLGVPVEDIAGLFHSPQPQPSSTLPEHMRQILLADGTTVRLESPIFSPSEEHQFTFSALPLQTPADFTAYPAPPSNSGSSDRLTPYSYSSPSRFSSSEAESMTSIEQAPPSLTASKSTPTRKRTSPDTSSPADTFRCRYPHCPKNNPSFDRACDLRKHMNSHVREFPCLESVCSNRRPFTCKADLTRHEQEQHNMHPERRKDWTCMMDDCERAVRGFKRKDQREDHMWRVHGVQKPVRWKGKRGSKEDGGEE